MNLRLSLKISYRSLPPRPRLATAAVDSAPASLDSNERFWNRVRQEGKRRSFDMPNDPNECRRQALAWVRLAQASTSPRDRQKFAQRAETWLALAGDLENISQPKSESRA